MTTSAGLIVDYYIPAHYVLLECTYAEVTVTIASNDRSLEHKVTASMTQSLPSLLRLVLSEPSVPCIAMAVAAQSAGADTPSTRLWHCDLLLSWV